MAGEIGRGAATRTVLADDATGALEAGVLLARACAEVRVELDLTAPAHQRAQARAVLVPTRHHANEEAYGLMQEALRICGEATLFLKTDSTLRGPIGACLQAILDARPHHSLVYVPAYPVLGRTVRRGVLLVHGQPLADTEFAADPLNPIRASNVIGMLAAGCREPFHHAASNSELALLLGGPRRAAVVCDAETEADVAALVETCRRSSRPLVLAGPAGCIRYWVPAPEPHEQTALPPVDRWLLVCGSRHHVSRAQAEAAASGGVDVLLSPSAFSGDPAGEARRLASIAAARGVKAFIVFGGDTALALWRHLGVRSLEPIREILPGVAVSRSGPFVFVTKAGGFGPPDLVARMLENWK